MTKLTELLEICNKAIPRSGKTIQQQGAIVKWGASNSVTVYGYCMEQTLSNIAAHIAALNPHTAKALILSLTKAIIALEFYAARSEHHPLGGDRAKDTLKQIHVDILTLL